jgi:dCTP deaminase
MHPVGKMKPSKGNAPLKYRDPASTRFRPAGDSAGAIPAPTGRRQECPYNTHSVDLTLSPNISIPKKGPYSFDVMQQGSLADFISANSKTIVIDEDAGFSLKPGMFVLGQTREWIGLPILPQFEKCLAARIEGKSSRARCGLLIHFTAPTVHPDWEGPLALEMINFGPVPFILRPGMPIAQLIVEEVSALPFKNPSQFQAQKSPEGTI